MKSTDNGSCDTRLKKHRWEPIEEALKGFNLCEDIRDKKVQNWQILGLLPLWIKLILGGGFECHRSISQWKNFFAKLSLKISEYKWKRSLKRQLNRSRADIRSYWQRKFFSVFIEDNFIFNGLKSAKNKQISSAFFKETEALFQRYSSSIQKLSKNM